MVTCIVKDTTLVSAEHRPSVPVVCVCYMAYTTDICLLCMSNGSVAGLFAVVICRKVYEC